MRWLLAILLTLSVAHADPAPPYEGDPAVAWVQTVWCPGIPYMVAYYPLVLSSELPEGGQALALVHQMRMLVGTWKQAWLDEPDSHQRVRSAVRRILEGHGIEGPVLIVRSEASEAQCAKARRWLETNGKLPV